METQQTTSTPAEESGELPVIKREYSPEEKAALAGFIPLNTDPFDFFTPDFFKENYPAPRWPVFHILKPTPTSRLKLLESDPAAAREAAKAKMEGRVPEFDPVRFAQDVYRNCKNQLRKFENYRPLQGEEIRFEADPDGRISDACLDKLGEALMVEVHLRYLSLFRLTPRELEGLGSRPASIPG